MENIYSRMDLNAYVAKYMDETGCNLKEACEELGININDVFNETRSEEVY